MKHFFLSEKVNQNVKLSSCLWCLFSTGVSLSLGTVGIDPSSVLHHWLWLLGVSFHFLQHPYNQDFNDVFSFLATKFASADMQFSVSASTSRWNQRWCHCTFQNNLSGFSLRCSREGLPLVDTRTSWRPLQFVDWNTALTCLNTSF